MRSLFLLMMCLLLPFLGFAEENSHPMGPSDCSHMEVWDYPMGMCMPRPMAGMPMKMLMFHGNAFMTETLEEKPRGRNAFSVPNMFMLDAGSSIGAHHYINLDFMGTLEKWTYPKEGTPELLQIGESQEDGTPFLDAQHPHSSPIMGLTLSDTIAFGNAKDFAKIWFAPRGESTDGPVAFMYRLTGMVKPDAPLGHHIGQDVGHISSTVIGGALRMSDSTLELSTFNGTEPIPTKVDLSLGTPNSYAARWTQAFTSYFYVMASAAYVKSPEPSEPELDHLWRYSVSAYEDSHLESGWMIHNTLIWGLINGYDSASALNSFAEEFWLHKGVRNIWGRLEVLQRTPAELEISGSSDANKGQWVTALTLGYTHEVASYGGAKFGLGGSLTKDFLPSDFQSAYGGNPVSGKVFLQVSGMNMWDL